MYAYIHILYIYTRTIRSPCKSQYKIVGPGISLPDLRFKEGSKKRYYGRRKALKQLTETSLRSGGPRAVSGH